MEDQNDGKDLKTLLESYERALILSALAASGGHQRRAAAALRLLPSTLCEKMKRLGIRNRGPATGAARPALQEDEGSDGQDQSWTR